MKKKLPFFMLALFLLVQANAQKRVTAQYNGEFSDGLAAIQLNNRWGFIDTEGNVVIEPKYNMGALDSIPFFREGLAAVRERSGGRLDEMVYINKSGELAFERRFNRAVNFSDGRAFVSPAGRFEHERVLINNQGEDVISRIRCAWIAPFKNNFARFCGDYIDRSGNVVIKGSFSAQRDFHEGLAAVQQGLERWGYIDTLGNVVIPFQFSREPQHFSNGRAFVMGTNNLWGFIDREGNLIAEPQYSQVFPFGSGVAVVSTTDRSFRSTFYIIDLDGKVLKTYPPSANHNEVIAFWSGFENGLAIASKGGSKGFVDPTGKVVIDFKYTVLKPFSSGRAYFERYDQAKRETTKGFIDEKGKEVIHLVPPMF